MADNTNRPSPIGPAGPRKTAFGKPTRRKAVKARHIKPCAFGGKHCSLRKKTGIIRIDAAAFIPQHRIAVTQDTPPANRIEGCGNTLQLHHEAAARTADFARRPAPQQHVLIRLVPVDEKSFDRGAIVAALLDILVADLRGRKDSLHLAASNAETKGG
ncbi:Hypothetical protein BROD_1554 [Brucella sp. NF 2653]|nr:Hypothetical protein BROD_1554 [Brucella sp. NF 2653]